MARLTKRTAKLHNEACELLKKDKLTFDEKWFVLEHWQESAKHINSLAGAFFTPVGLARDFAIEVCGARILDICAGIGALSFMKFHCGSQERTPEITCVELNPDYAEVGRKILPEATWLVCNALSMPDLGHFDVAISNPPFGSTQRNGLGAPRYTGPAFEYHIIDIASDLADYGAFIVPQPSAPFSFSGKRCFEHTLSDAYKMFSEKTGIDLHAGCGIDTDYHRDGWHFTAPATEVVVADFEEARAKRAARTKPTQDDLFGQETREAA